MGILTRHRGRIPAPGDPVPGSPAPGDPALGDASPDAVEPAAHAPLQSRRVGRRRRTVGEWTFGTHLATRAVHAALAVAMVCGPLALVVAVAGRSGQAPSRQDVTATVEDPGPSQRASASAMRLVTTWLSGGQADAASVQDQLAQPVTDVDLQLPAARPAAPLRVWVSDVVAFPAGRWAVTVGVQTATGGSAWFTVPVQTDTVGAVALTLPARTAAPAKATVPDPDGRLTVLDLSDPASVTAVGYLSALTTGSGDLDRWTSPGATMTAISPAPCRPVTVQQVQTRTDPVPSSTVDGAELAVLVSATCTAPAPAHLAPATSTSQYPLLLRARGSRWEVAQTNPAFSQPTTPTSADPPAAGSGTPAPAGPTRTPSR